MQMTARTLFDKIWDRHVAARLEGDRAVLVIDRVMLHEITGAYALREMCRVGQRPRLAPANIYAVADHAISTNPGRGNYDSVSQNWGDLIESLERSSRVLGIRYAPPDSAEHGIVHVIAPEQGFVHPGMTLVCGDSHTCTLGALGALAFAVGATEIGTVLKHKALIVRKPSNMRITFSGAPGRGVCSKDMMLSLIAANGSDMAIGCAVEFAGAAVTVLDVEARLTLCNMAAEMGTRYALIAPDAMLATFLATTRTDGPFPDDLYTDPDAAFAKEVGHCVEDLVPHVTWGTLPMHACGIGGSVPDPADVSRQASDVAAATRALGYMALEPGTPLESIAIDAAFIGSCTNARLGDLRSAAAILKGRRIAPGVRAMCTPGSMAVRRAAETEGLDEVFRAAGFEWRMPGCSNCAGREGPIWKGMRVVSSTNRNFENRQGPGTRTHLASPATVAASAVRGRISDPRNFL